MWGKVQMAIEHPLLECRRRQGRCGEVHAVEFPRGLDDLTAHKLVFMIPDQATRGQCVMAAITFQPDASPDDELDQVAGQ